MSPEQHPQVSYCIMTSCGVEKGSVSSVIRPEYLCEVHEHPSGYNLRILSTRTLYWERDGTLIESEWKKLSGSAASLLPDRVGGYEVVKEVSREEAVFILLTADKMRKIIL